MVSVSAHVSRTLRVVLCCSHVSDLKFGHPEGHRAVGCGVWGPWLWTVTVHRVLGCDGVYRGACGRRPLGVWTGTVHRAVG